MSRQADPAKSKQYRVEHGLCPACGKESAPYYLCSDCRFKGAIVHRLKRMVKAGAIETSKSGNSTLYKPAPNMIEIADTMRWGKEIFGKAGSDSTDGRLRPRLGRRPVDLDETLVGIFFDAGKPLTMEEVVTAWGRLRSKRKTESLAGDMRAIIEAQRKRDRRAAKWAEVQARLAARAGANV